MTDAPTAPSDPSTPSGASARSGATTTPAFSAPGNAGYVDVRRITVAGAPVAVVTLNRPDKLNGLTLGMLKDLAAASRDLRGDRDLRAVILEGAGPSFSAGLDFASALRSPTALGAAFVPGLDGVNVFQRACWGWRRVPVPVVAVVRGHCYGGGAQLALGADFRVTAPDARWSVMEAKWGLVPDMSGMRTLVDAVGADRAKRLAMTAEELDGATAAEWGLATDVSDVPRARAEQIIAELVTRSPDQLAAVKRLTLDASRSPRAVFRRERIEQIALLARENTARARKAAFSKGREVAAFARRGTWAGRGDD